MCLSTCGVVGMYTMLVIFFPPWMDELLGQGLAIIDRDLPSAGSVLVTLGPAGRTLGEKNGRVRGHAHARALRTTTKVHPK